MTTYLDEYRFNDAAARIYSFIWHEFCDWYLELVKPVLYAGDSTEKRLAAQETLVEALTTTMKMLHPFMPFLTEEIWHMFVKDGSSIMVSEFPLWDEAKKDDKANEQMSLIIDVITNIRNIRGEMNIHPSKKLKVILAAPDGKAAATLKEGAGYIANIARVEDLKIESAIEEPKGVATAVAGPVQDFRFPRRGRRYRRGKGQAGEGNRQDHQRPLDNIQKTRELRFPREGGRGGDPERGKQVPGVPGKAGNPGRGPGQAQEDSSLICDRTLSN